MKKQIEDGRTHGDAAQVVIGIVKRDFGFKRIEFEAHRGTIEFTAERTGERFADLDSDDALILAIFDACREAVGDRVSLCRWIDENGTAKRITINTCAGHLDPVGVFNWLSYRGEMETVTYGRKSYTARSFHHRREDLLLVKEAKVRR